jgi:glycerol-3-phosphate dehydrogenase
MKRALSELVNHRHDVLVIGGGIYGACIAWDAVLRGLSVALVEKADFGSATSANSLKIIHGGLRYLQHGDLKRMRESTREQTNLMRIAPHLVNPLPVLIPAYGHGLHSKRVLALALRLNELISFDRNRLNDPQKHIPPGRVISRREALDLAPGIRQQDLTGGIIFHDAQVYNPERLVLSFLRSAEEAGARLANYVEATEFIKQGDRVTGVKARDVLSGAPFDIHAGTVVNACGPWLGRLLSFFNGCRPARNSFAKAINLVTRQVFQKCAVGVTGENCYRDADALIVRRNRFLFLTPWRSRSVIGTTYSVYDGDAENIGVTEEEIENLLSEINQACPGARLRMEDVSFVHRGLLPSTSMGQVQLINHHAIRDHRQEGVRGVLSVTGVKYTTARHVAEKVVDRLFEGRRQKPPKSVSSTVPLHGGKIERFDGFLSSEINKQRCRLGTETMQRLVHNYGSSYAEVLAYVDERQAMVHGEAMAVLRAQILHGIRNEMAHTLSDVVFRRTELGTAGHPGSETLSFCANIMSTELGWTPSRTQQELQQVNERFAVVSAKNPVQSVGTVH